MRNKRTIVAILVVLALAMTVPNVSSAQSDQSGQAPQPTGGVATVIAVDQPGNCLRIRSGPGNSYDVIGCADLGQQLNITGVWTSNNWVQLADNGWVFGDQIQTDLRPPTTAFSESENYAAVENEYPTYYYEYPDYYLPDYGYNTYWYGSVPIYVYGINVWRKYHPWWWHRHGGRHQNAWDRNRGFRHGVTTGTANNFLNNRAVRNRNFVTNRSNLSSLNATRFNANRLRSRSSNVIRSGRVFSNPNTLRSFSRPNTVRNFSVPNTVRNFSRSNTLHMGSLGTRNFARNFSAGHVGGSHMAARAGGGVRIGGGAHFHAGGGRHR